jgi:hypothetical protein
MPNQKLTPQNLAALKRTYQQCKKQLLDLDWIAQGSVMPKPPRAWRMTHKVKGKSVSVALSAEQASLYRQAVAENRKLQAILGEMRLISRKALLGPAPGGARRHGDHPKRA